jgi:hypothetical protein
MTEVLEEVIIEGKKNYQSIGGWLIFVIITYVINGYLIANNIQAILSLISDGTLALISNPESVYYIPSFTVLIIYELIITILTEVYIITALVFMVKKKSIYPKLAIGFYIFVLVTGGIDLLFTYQVANDFINATMIGKYIGSIAHAIILTNYFLRSKRVKNTFVN